MTRRGLGGAVHRLRLAAALLALAAFTACAPAGPRRTLIEFGWDEPNTAFLRRWIGAMERTPFDGCVFHADLVRPDGRTVNLAWHFWGREAFAWQQAQQACEDLWHTPRGRFRALFLRLNVTPGDVDWFDDFSPVVANARLAGRLVRESEVAGILLDTEPYDRPLFDYRRQRQAGSRSWDDYAAQARRRGRELMGAFEASCPGITILLTFAYELPRAQMRRAGRPLEDCRNGLLVPFLDGLIDGAKSARLVAAHEMSYGYRRPEAFEAAHARLRTGVLPLVGDPDRYRAVVSVGFGLWMDHRFPRFDWSEEDFSRNYFAPEGLERSLCAALRRSDEIVWVYSEQPRWWTPEGGPARLPEAYVQAVRRARRCAGLPR